MLRRVYRFLTNVIYVSIAFSMIAASGTIVVWSGWNAVSNLSMGKAWIEDILTSIGALVVALAIVDVANYLFEEEIFKSNELRTPAESRKTLTKISVIIIIAISLEGLVYTFKSGSEDIALLIYPAFVILVAGVFMLLLGLYERVSIAAEKLDDENESGRAKSLRSMDEEKEPAEE